MGRQNNRTCIICGKQYHYCPNCGEDAGKPTWYFVFDGQNCHDIYDVCTNYRDGKIDVAKAYELISNLDISEINSFQEATRAQINEIIKNGKPVNRNITAPNNSEDKETNTYKSNNKNLNKRK